MSLGSQEWGAVAVACESMGSNRLFLYVLAEHAVGAALIMLMHLRLHSLLYIYIYSCIVVVVVLQAPLNCLNFTQIV